MTRAFGLEGLKQQQAPSAFELNSGFRYPKKGNPFRKEQTVYQIDDEWIYDCQNRKLSNTKNQTVKLREKTAAVLNLLIERQHRVVETQDFFEYVWNGRQVSENVLKQSIKELRTSFKDNKKQLIKTVPRKGYSLHAKLRVHAINDTVTPITESEKLTFNLSESNDNSEQPSNSEQPVVKDLPFNLNNHYEPKCTTKQPVDIETHPNLNQFKSIIKSRFWSLFALTLVTVWALVISYQYVKTHQQLSDRTIKITEIQSKKDFYQDILIRYHDSPEQDRNTLNTILKKSIGQIDAFNGSDIEKIGMLNGLMELYTVAGFYENARVIVNRIEKLIKLVYGVHSEEHIKLNFNLIDLLIKLNKRQEALNLSQAALENVMSNFASNTYLLAKAYYYSGKAHLYCVAPFCNRDKVLLIGEQHTEQALALFSDTLDPNSIEVADTIWLLNWFIWDGDEKIKLSQQALSIYQNTQGLTHEKTASALEQLARTLTFWNKEWKIGEQMLFQALEVRKKLFPDIHPEMGKIHSYIGEHFFMTGQLDLASHYLTLAIDINTASLGEGNSQNLQNIMLIARAQLYLDNTESANQWIELAFDIIERHKLTPPDIIFDAIIVTQLRIETALNHPKSFEKIEQEIPTLKEKFKSPKSLLLHEYQTQLLKIFPSNLNEHYVKTIEHIKEKWKPSSRYLYQTDLEFLKKRALENCAKINPETCPKITAALSTD
ncbi:MAG: winged helix-turn-helix domain-containing protein [Gammaproteobacteria bacterium]|nr:winged helix-turn-helix domain-containing protein [Gammaproteobacteria bacterium]